MKINKYLVKLMEIRAIRSVKTKVQEVVAREQFKEVKMGNYYMENIKLWAARERPYLKEQKANNLVGEFK